MYSLTSRLSAIGSHASWVLFVFSVATIIATHFIYTPEGTATVRVTSAKGIQRRREAYTETVVDLAQLKLDVEANLTSLYNWNTKVVYFYVKTEYESPRANKTEGTKRNEIIVWDKVVRKDSTVFSHKNIKTKYTFYDPGTNFRSREVKISPCWMVISWFGFCPLHCEEPVTFTLPSKYIEG